MSAKKQVAVIGSMHCCPMCSGTTPHVGGPVIGPGAAGVTINGQIVALQGDQCSCVGAVDTIVQGSSGVFINGVPIATVGSMTAHGGQITTGIPGVTISANTPQSMATLPPTKIPFPKHTLINQITGNTKEAKEKQEQLKETTQGQPRVYNLKWKKEETIIKEEKVLKIVSLTADVQNIPDGQQATIKVIKPSVNDGDNKEEVIELVANVKDKKVVFEWELEDASTNTSQNNH